MMDLDLNYEPDSEESDEQINFKVSKNENIYKCTIAGCKAAFPKSSRLQRHINVHENKRSYKCTQEGCDKSYFNSSHLKRHMEIHLKITESQTCDSSVSILPNMEKSEESLNLQVVNRGKTYKCTIAGCEAVFLRPSRLQRHLNVHENKRPYKCTHEGCNKSYTNSSHLKRHVESHSIIAKLYTCSICSVSISSISNLKRHYSRAHNADRELYCQECHMRFRKKNRFEEHMEAHKNSSQFKCEKCGKVLLTHKKLVKHIQMSHENKKIYKCHIEDCPLVFDRWLALLKHRKTEHISEFNCSQCDLMFFNKTRLKVHLKTHANNRPTIACPYKNCHRLYYFKRNLDTHILRNHLGNRFLCDICERSLSTKQKLRYHITTQHQSETKPLKRKQSAPRKDIGLAKRSALSELTGIQLSVKAEIRLMKRNPAALLRDKIIEEYSSFSEDDKAPDINTKSV